MRLIGALALFIGLLGGQPADLSRVQVGHQAPDFTLDNAEGRRTTLSDYRGRKRVVLLFYRGYW